MIIKHNVKYYRSYLSERDFMLDRIKEYLRRANKKELRKIINLIDKDGNAK